MAFCTNCGSELTINSSFCGGCGAATTAQTNAQTQSLAKSIQPVFSITDDEKIFIGKNYPYFRRKRESEALNKSKGSWNWAAFVFGFLWLAYRKMYRYAWLFVGAIVVDSMLESAFNVSDRLSHIIGLAFGIACGLFGNHWYRLHVETKVREINSLNPPDKAKIELAQQGGTNIGLPIGFVVALVAPLALVDSLVQ